MEGERRNPRRGFLSGDEAQALSLRLDKPAWVTKGSSHTVYLVGVLAITENVQNCGHHELGLPTHHTTHLHRSLDRTGFVASHGG